MPALAAAAAVAAARAESTAAAALAEEFEQRSDNVLSVLGYLPEVVRVCGRMGGLAVLERLVGGTRGLDARLDRFGSSVCAILAEARAEHDVAEALYARAEQGWLEYGCVVERAHALLGLGRCRLALERPDEAVQPLRDAREIFTSLGAQALVVEVDGLLAALATASA